MLGINCIGAHTIFQETLLRKIPLCMGVASLVAANVDMLLNPVISILRKQPQTSVC